MLVLSRKRGERICVGRHIEITVLAIRGNRVRLGVAAPPSVLIQRRELVARDADVQPPPKALPSCAEGRPPVE